MLTYIRVVMINKVHATVEIENLNFSYQGNPLLNIDYLKMDKPGITVVLGPPAANVAPSLIPSFIKLIILSY